MAIADEGERATMMVPARMAAEKRSGRDAPAVKGVLTQARDAFFADRFIESEQALDRALQMMGVQPQ